MTRSERHAFIERKLQQVHPNLARKVRAIISDLEGHGWEPTIGSGWRSVEEQRAILARGDSTVSFSFHNAELNGKPAALAVDIVDARWGWDSPKRFWTHLGSSANAHKCVWGGNWKRFPDVAHVQLLSNDMLAKVKRGYSPAVVV